MRQYYYKSVPEIKQYISDSKCNRNKTVYIRQYYSKVLEIKQYTSSSTYKSVP